MFLSRITHSPADAKANVIAAGIMLREHHMSEWNGDIPRLYGELLRKLHEEAQAQPGPACQ
ncbi:MAG: hypothetical protein P4L40_10620 [Terracidiphilus sp.]|nr:hypothetical protein [Terracidiphilus sp.]